MNAVTKVAWVELVVSVLATAAVLIMYPWMGQAALSGFALLGLLGFTPFLMRKRGDEVVRDERDAEIEKTSSWFGFGAAWMVTLLALVFITLWHSHRQLDVPTSLLTILIWSQFALCYAIKGGTALLQYRGHRRAA